ncbi:MAG: hypothetical protein H7070_09495 [Saprospiraceae bacterium]|nr:hypothetical protein [Pyrinomonadaceae bacterium]
MRKIHLAVVLGVLLLSRDALAQKEFSIAQVQGETNTSPLAGQNVRVSGIVTARVRTGFFIQTPDDRSDKNPATSEGIFVYTRTAPQNEAAVGNSVSVTGDVEEFRRNNEPFSLTLTEISMRKGRDEVKVISRSNQLPKPVTFTAEDFKSNKVDQLERYEGMRVQVAELTVVAPTGGRVDIKRSGSTSDGVFFGVVKGMPRPFREPGLDIREYTALAETGKFKSSFPRLPVFDSNPETIRVDTNEQFILPESVKTASAFRPFIAIADVAAQTELKSLIGVLHYNSGKYTIFTDLLNKPSVSGSLKPNPLPSPTDRQFSVAGMNLENFFDDQDDPGIKEDIVTPEAFQRRLKKISLAIRDVMKTPDVIGIIEAENLSALKRLAEKINADAVTAGKPDPKYEAFLIEGNDGRGIDNGFLVKTARVKILETRQLGKDDKYRNPETKEEVFSNDRTPLMLRASIVDPKSGQPFEFIIIVNHLKSYLGYNDPKRQDNVRLKKRLQAEYLATFVQERQKANPNERIILLGDFNAYQFSDGVLDLIGTIKGSPAAKDEVFNSSEDLVNPDLIDLVDVIEAKQQYSYVFDGNAQAIDHIIINEALRKHINGFGFARVNADFPEVLRNDDTRPERFSDHDPAVAYFSFDDTAASLKP